MASVGSLVVDLIANTASFNSNIEKAAANLNSSTAKINRSLATMQKEFHHVAEMGKLLVEALAVREVAEAVKGSLEFAAAMKISADQIGITAEQMQIYHLAGKRVGTAQEEMDVGLKKFTVTLGKAELGAKAQKDELTKLGINYHATTTVALQQFMDKMHETGDASKRHAVEVSLMGRAAVSLDPMLKKGAESFKDFGEEAKKAGLILGNDVAEKGHEAAVQIEELNTKLKVDWSTEVAKNADAIMGLASALQHLEVAALQFIAAYPKLSGAVAGAGAGLMVTKSPLGAAAGAAAGFVFGRASEQEAENSNNDLQVRARLLQISRNNLRGRLELEKHPIDKFIATQKAGSLPSVQDFTASRDLQIKFWNRSVRAKRAQAIGSPVPEDNIPSNLMAGAGRHHAAKRDPLADAPERYGREMAQINEAILQARRGNLTDIDAIAKIDKELLVKEFEAKGFAIEKDVADKHITAAQGAQLKVANAILAVTKAHQIDVQAAEQHAQENLQVMLAANDNQKEMLGLQDQLATTTKEHRDIQLRILALAKLQEKSTLEATIASATATKADKDIAAAKLKGLNEKYAAQGEVVKDNTMGPGEAYLKSIIDDAAKVNEAIENIKVHGLQSLNDGLVEAIMGAKSLGDVFKNVANQIIADLLRIAVKKLIIGPIARAIFGERGSGKGTGFGYGQGDGGDGLPGYASGTSNAAPGLAMVGENGPELVRFRGGQQVVPNNMLRSGGGAVQVEIVDTTGLFVTRVNGQIMSAAPALAEAGSSVAQSRLAYRQSRSLAA